MNATLLRKTAAPRPRALAFLALCKLRLNMLVMAAAGMAYVVAEPHGAPPGELPALMLGVLLAACGTSALNMALEGPRDRLMTRTCRRPVASGELSMAEAAVFGTLLSLAGFAVLLAWTNALTAALCGLTVALYVLVYTPLKTRTTLNTVVGAVPGALPVLVGWAAARGGIGPEALSLPAIVFFWQFPHFLAIASIYREDYRLGGFRMLPVEDPDGLRTGLRVVSAGLLLVPVSLLPAVTGVAGAGLYAPGALLLSLGYLAFGVRAAVRRTPAAWRHLLRASFLHLPMTFFLMMLDRMPS